MTLEPQPFVLADLCATEELQALKLSTLAGLSGCLLNPGLSTNQCKPAGGKMISGAVWSQVDRIAFKVRGEVYEYRGSR